MQSTAVLSAYPTPSVVVDDPAADFEYTSFTYKLARLLLRMPIRILERFQTLSHGSPSPETSVRYVAKMNELHSGVHHDAFSIPGPLGFMTSGYFFLLIFMGIVLHRMQHIIVPMRYDLLIRYRIILIGREVQSSRQLWAAFLRLFFPVDFSKTSSRFVTRIPSMYFLLKALTHWTVILLSMSNLWPERSSGNLHDLGVWATQAAIEDVCWSTFKAVCLALLVASLTSGMETWRPSGNAPFNLVGYSFTLYVYGSPGTHPNRQAGLPSRPDVHVIITMMLPLLELTMIHCLEVKQSWGRRRLIPTTIAGVLSLVHFHMAVWVWPSAYPMPNMFPNTLESFLIAVTLITCGLNAFAQLLASGTITKPLAGHAATLMPRWDEDFSVALFRIGTASLSATSAAGLGNEVSSVTQASGDVSRAPLEPEAGTVEISRVGVVHVERPRHSKAKGGFANEIKNIKPMSRPADAWMDMLISPAWTKGSVRFARALWDFLRGLWRITLGSRRPATQPQQPPSDAPAAPTAPVRARRARTPAADADDVYARFLRGDDFSDDSDGEGEFDPATVSRSSTPSGASDMSDDEAELGSASDALTLYADLSRAAGASPAPLLLAHMTDTAASPLTRRRYSSILDGNASSSSAAGGGWEAFVRERREAKRPLLQDTAALDDRRICVICTAEPREIICWPCRCLALCDDCRENLASRAPSSRHLCPCCRSNVEGFSKIYIP